MSDRVRVMGEELAVPLRQASLTVVSDPDAAVDLVVADLRGDASLPPLRDGVTLLAVVDGATPDRLRLRADDYLLYPWTDRQLLTRVRFHLAHRPQPPRRVTLAGCSVDLGTGEVSTGERLTGMERALLGYLVQHQGRVVPRAELEQAVWDLDHALDTGRVYVGIRRLREKIETDPKRPRHVLTVRGEGYRFEGFRAPVQDAWSIPPPQGPCIGREAELRQVLAQLEHGGVVLLGAPGAGRSWLAAQVADTWRGRGPGLLLEEPGELTAVRRALEEHAPQVSSPVLLWLERPGADVVEGLAGLRAERPGLQLLVCADRPLAGLSQVVLGPLNVEASVEVLQAGGAVGDPDALRGIAELLDGLPLALVLVAERLQVEDAAAVRDGLRSGGRSGAADDALGWSLATTLERLPDAVERVALQLSVFAGPFELSAADAVVDGGGVADAVTVLLRAGIVRRTAVRGAQLALVRPLRDRLRARLETDPTLLHAARERHERWVMDRCGALLTQLDGGHSELADRLSAARGDVLEVLARVEQVDPQRSAMLVRTLVRGLRDAWRPASLVAALLDRTLARADRLAAEDAVALRLTRAKLVGYAGRRTEALRDLAAAEQRAGEGLPSLDVWRVRALLERVDGRLADAVRTYTDLEARAESLGAEAHQIDAWRGLGAVRSEQGRLDDAAGWFERALVALRDRGDRWRVAAVQDSLGWVRRDQGESSEARSLVAAALDGVREVAGRRREDSGEAVVLAHLGVLERDAGRLGDAEAQLRASLALLGDPWNRRWQARVQTELAWTLWAQGLADAAQALARDARAPCPGGSLAAAWCVSVCLEGPLEVPDPVGEDPRDATWIALARAWHDPALRPAAVAAAAAGVGASARWLAQRSSPGASAG